MQNKIMPCVIVVPSDTAQIDITANDIDTIISTLSGTSGAIYIDSGSGDYDLLNDGFSSEAVQGVLNNLKNPRRTQKLSFQVPVPNGASVAIDLLRSNYIALGAETAPTYNVYTFDPYSDTYGEVSQYLYAKILVDEVPTPDGAIYNTVVETLNEDNYFSTEVVQTT